MKPKIHALSLSLSILLLTFPVLTHAASGELIGGMRVLPPAYLGVPKWQKCLANITCGTAQYVCLPKLKPKFCPYKSWRQLKDERLLSDCIVGCQNRGSARK